ncbi:protein HIDE1 isoform X2 [Ambystoma mexicanum]|uniref:protein HIDE1 isoform X2 n=1 Tax=Ambystoma mexicanum TaxID=8296 RepID=UPI0037E6FE8E
MAKRNPINCRRELPLFHTSLRWADCHARAPHPWSRSTSEAMAHPLLLLCLGVVWGATSGTSPELPAPAISLDEGRPDVEGQPAAARIRCTAPSNYLEGTFFLYREGKSMPVQELGAPESRHSVTFALPGAAPAGHYRCRYNAWVSDKLRGSELSSPLWLNMTGYALSSSPAAQGNASEETGAPAWIVPLSVGGSIALLLVIVLVAVVAVKCGALNSIVYLRFDGADTSAHSEPQEDGRKEQKNHAGHKIQTSAKPIWPTLALCLKSAWNQTGRSFPALKTQRTFWRQITQQGSVYPPAHISAHSGPDARCSAWIIDSCLPHHNYVLRLCLSEEPRPSVACS